MMTWHDIMMTWHYDDMTDERWHDLPLHWFHHYQYRLPLNPGFLWTLPFNCVDIHEESHDASRDQELTHQDGVNLPDEPQSDRLLVKPRHSRLAGLVWLAWVPITTLGLDRNRVGGRLSTIWLSTIWLSLAIDSWSWLLRVGGIVWIIVVLLITVCWHVKFVKCCILQIEQTLKRYSAGHS